MKTFEVVTKSRRQETDQICSFEFLPEDGTPVPAYPAGSSLTLQLPTGDLRTYSLLDSGTAPSSLRIAVLRQELGRGGSRFLHEEVYEGTRLRVSHLSKSFDTVLAPAPHILIAGGIGITPILSLARYFSENNQAFHLHYGASCRAHAAFVDALASSSFSASVRMYFTTSGRRMDIGALLADHAEGSHLYCCGPSGMMNAVATAAAHWPVGTVHFDSFSAEAPATPEDGERAFKVKLTSNGTIIDIPADQTVLSVLTQRGIPVSSQCGQGHCGSCLTPVLEGRPDHRDRVLTDEERAANDLMALCCSRSLSDLLVLDL